MRKFNFVKLSILKILLIGGIGVLAFSCTTEIESPEKILAQMPSSTSLSSLSSSSELALLSSSSGEAESSSSDGDSGSSGLEVSSSGGDGSSSSVVASSSSSSITASSSSVVAGNVSCPNAVTGSNTVTCGGQNYKTVQIGTQIWMAENLNYNASGSKCGNGSSLSDANTANCDTYGRLYDWETAETVCPSGWHLPSNEEWRTLMDYVESQGGCNNCTGMRLKAASGWNGSGGNGTDNHGFSALPGGKGNWDSSFDYVGVEGHWWSSTEYEYYAPYAYRWYISYNLGTSYSDKKTSLHSVRCLRNYSSSSSSIAASSSSSSGSSSSSSAYLPISYGTLPYEGQNYKTVQIGDQVWMAENLNYAVSGSKCGDGSSLSDANTTTCDTYGRLYDWATAMRLNPSCNNSSNGCVVQSKHQGICPSGWFCLN